MEVCDASKGSVTKLQLSHDCPFRDRSRTMCCQHSKTVLTFMYFRELNTDKALPPIEYVPLLPVECGTVGTLFKKSLKD